jgi:hypothetical protein
MNGDARTLARRIWRPLGIALFGVALGAGCSSDVSPAATPLQPSPPATPSAPPSVSALSGTVVEWSPLGERPIGGVSVNAWVKQERSAYSYWFRHGPRATDADGRYELTNLPIGATVYLDVRKPGYLQQCAAEIAILGTAHQLDARLVSETVISASADAVPPAPGRHVRGVVYDVTAEGRRPAAKAYVWFEAGMDFDTATTVSDAQGRFLLCGLSAQAVRLGFADFASRRVAYYDVPAGSDATVELELK